VRSIVGRSSIFISDDVLLHRCKKVFFYFFNVFLNIFLNVFTFMPYSTPLRRNYHRTGLRPTSLYRVHNVAYQSSSKSCDTNIKNPSRWNVDIVPYSLRITNDVPAHVVNGGGDRHWKRKNSNSEGLVTLTLTLDLVTRWGSTHRPLPTYRIPFNWDTAVRQYLLQQFTHQQ